ncbi:hypothetical protein ACIGIJ_19100 [Bacillus paranthracis]|uniref:hypothetical protein n=1 Tax=Bacillus paranthracis TaxID=2026186 RepID=UPI0037C5FF2C
MAVNYKDKFVGIKIYGFCNGYFGRDDYDDKVIIASGNDWIVGVDNQGINCFASFRGEEDSMEELIGKWSKEEDC